MTLLLIAWALVATIAAIVGWAGLVETQQQLTRIQARAETVLRAAATVRQERDEQEALAESQGSLIAAYRRANDRLFECLKDHMEADEWAALDPGLTVYDRLVTDVLDRETWGGSL